MKNLKFTCLALLTIIFASSCAVEQAKFEITVTTTRRALLEGDIKEALASYEAQALEAEKNAQASWFSQHYWGVAVNAYLEAASAARFSGQLHKAIAYGEKALEIAERTKVPVWNRVGANLDYPPLPELSAIFTLLPIYRSVREFDRARVLIEKGFTLVRETPPSDSPRRLDSESILYAALGNDLVRRGEYDKAIDAHLQAVYLRRSHIAARTRERYYDVRARLVENSETHLTGLLANLGNVYRLVYRLEDALQQYKEAFSYVKMRGSRAIYEQELFVGLGDVYLQQKHFPLALENFQKALPLAEKQQRPAAISSASLGIGAVLRQTGKPAEAIPYYQKAIQQIESTRSVLQSEEYRRSFFEGGLDAYVSMVGALLESDKQEEAFNYNERARSRVFLDVLGSRVQLSRVKTGLLEEERVLLERIAGLEAQLAGEEETERVGLRKELEVAEKAYSAFLAKVRKQDKEQASLITVEPLTLREVQQLLDPGTTLIEYFVTERDIFIWVVEKEKLQFQRVALPKEDLGRSVKTLRESIFSLGEKNKFDEASASLYKQLIEPLVSHITGKELIIVPHDVLHYLPFHALVGPDGHYLIEKYPVYYLSSASLLQFVKEKRKSGGEKVLAFGNPDLGDPEKNLEYAELEAEEVKNIYPQSTVYVKKEASEEKSKSLSPTHDILHFATHAQLNEDDPLSSAVLLAKEDKEDGRLEVREIFGMDLKANLVVLSGCDTGLGKLSTGDELVGLTRAFIYAGTPSVVASLWSVDDSSTAHLMSSFYRNLKTMSKVEALRQAQLELIRGEGRSDLLARRGVGGIGKLGETPKSQSPSQNPISISTSHPYFWAPFILVGDGK
jgi:CHAT domain-containing protein/lipopolysaccharide biosynthesis regulator YciM